MNVNVNDILISDKSLRIITGERLLSPTGLPVSEHTKDSTQNNIWDVLGPGDSVEFILAQPIHK